MDQEQERKQAGFSFSEQFEAHYSTEKKRAERKVREARDQAEARERDRIRGIFAGTGIGGTI